MSRWHRSAATVKPVGPRPIYQEHRADFLTMVLENGEPEFVGLEQYQQMSDERRARCRAAHVKAGMTRYCVGVCFDGGDHIADPVSFLPILKELHADGLGPMIFVCPEDSPQMQKKYADVNFFIETLQDAMNFWQPWVTEIWFGVEADEVWKADKWLRIAEGVRSYGKPIVLHLLSGNVLPRDVSDSNWWAKASQAGITHFGYQANHPKVEDAGGAFLADPNTIRNELRAAVQAVRGHVQVISSEYAYFGRNPSKKTIELVSSVGYRLGEKSLEEPGIVGITNGGPGYWPPEEPVDPPVGSADEIDINQVHFYTRDGQDLTGEIRKWAIDSKLSPEFSGGKVFFHHTQAASWPVYEGGNANTWSIIWYQGAWRGYTTDYLRPGHQNVKKDWLHPTEGINHWIREPITYRIQSGEQFYFMVSRLDPRINKYPVGKSRTNIVKVVSP